MKLSSFTQGRDNNFNLIRMLAALSVLVSHSYALTTGISDAQPFARTLGMTLGTIAVDIFFITSGFLVTASLLNRQSTLEFIMARILRIYPALLIVLLLTVFGLGVYFTRLPLQQYLTDHTTYAYLRRGLTLITGVSLSLPGVFENTPLKGEVNSSLWTLPFEIRMYSILAIAWVILGLMKPARYRVFEILVVMSAVLTGAAVLLMHIGNQHANVFYELYFMFFTGASFYVLRDRIHLTYAIFIPLVLALLLAISHRQIFFVVYSLSIAYLLFFLAYVPSGFIRKYNRLGDYSYGIYIYAYPVQQSIEAMHPGISIARITIVSTLITLAFSVISWHYLERRALGLKGITVFHARRILGKNPATPKQ